MKRIVLIALSVIMAFACVGCAGKSPLKNRGAASVLFYNEPMEEGEAFGTNWLSQDKYTGGLIKYRDALKLRRYVNSIKNWTDDDYCDRKEFIFIGEFQVLNNACVYYFTEDGTVYYDHYFGRLSDKGLEFLMSLKP